MIKSELLEILRCPKSGQRLTIAPENLLFDLRARQKAGELRQANGELVTEPFQSVLVREDGTVGFFIRDGIPILLMQESVALGAS